MGAGIGCQGDAEGESIFEYMMAGVPMCRGGKEAPMPHLFSIPWYARGEVPEARILVYGDSITAGFCKGGEDYHPYAQFLVHDLMPTLATDVWMCGLNGLTAEQLARDVDEDMILDSSRRRGAGLRAILQDKGPFDMALIMAGTNDLSLEGIPDASSILQSIKALHRACHSAGVHSISMSIPTGRPVDDMYTEYYALRDTVNSMLESWSRTSPGVALHIDTSRIVPFDSHVFWEPDGLHLSPHGSKQLGAQVAATLPACLTAEGKVKRKV
mmetsp:Transcript_25746/g.47051  ORF Transcript_25746/g.47051 Transcript_25746/m.47051 type:complete len:270 (-) Transcript_25746:104-913(-)